MVKKMKAYWIFIMSEQTYKLTFLSGGGICSRVLAHTCTHTHTETWKPFSVFRNIYWEKFKADWTEQMIHLTCLQFVVFKVISLARESAFTLLGQQVTGSSPGWGTWNFSGFKYLCIVLARFTTEGVCLFPKLGAFWRFVTHVIEDLGMWKALSPEDFHHEMGWIIEQIIHWSVVFFYLVYTPLEFEDLDAALRKKEMQTTISDTFASPF